MTDIDRQIAEKVMELRISHISDEHTIGPTAAGVGHYRIKPYSTDMNCAMEVIEKMHSMGYTFICDYDHATPAYIVSFDFMGFDESPNASLLAIGAVPAFSWNQSLPMAICLAALKMKEEG